MGPELRNCERTATGLRLVVLLVSLFTLPPALGKTAPYFLMDSMAFLAEKVVLCEEIGFSSLAVEHGDFTIQERVGEYRVIKAFKGTVKEGDKLRVLVGNEYAREPSPLLPARSILRDTKWLKNGGPPLGEALLFLTTHHSVEMPYPVVGGIKLITTKGVLGYGQFGDSPGPLWLIDQLPENLEGDSYRNYGKAEFLRDVQIALQRSQRLQKASWMWPHDYIDKYDRDVSFVPPPSALAIGDGAEGNRTHEEEEHRIPKGVE